MPTSTMSTVPLPLTSGSLEAKQLIWIVVGSTVQLAAITGLVEVIATRNRRGPLSGPAFIVRLNVLVKMVVSVVVFAATTETVPVMMWVVVFAMTFANIVMLMLSNDTWIC